MKLVVSEDCIGCGACIDTCPEVFDWNEDGTMAKAIDADVPDANTDAATQAMSDCPVGAISEE